MSWSVPKRSTRFINVELVPSADIYTVDTDYGQLVSGLNMRPPNRTNRRHTYVAISRRPEFIVQRCYHQIDTARYLLGDVGVILFYQSVDTRLECGRVFRT